MQGKKFKMKRLAHAEAISALESRRMFAGNPIAFGSNTYDSASRAVPTPDGGSIVTGIFSGTADFDPGSGKTLLTAQGDSDIFAAKYSASGALVWVKQFGNGEGDFDSDKSVEFAIDPALTRDFDPGVGLNPPDLGEYVTGLAVDSSGNAYITGAFRGMVDFDPGHGKLIFSSFGGKNYVDTFFLKLSGSTGSLVYGKQIGGQFTDFANGIAVDSSNNVYLTGYFSRSADFDPSSKKLILNASGREDIFVAKYDASGNVVWAKYADCEEITRVKRSAGNAIAVDGAGDVVITGTFAGKTYFEPASHTQVLEPDDLTDVFVEKLSASDGSVTWVKSFGGEEYDGGVAVALGTDGTIYTGSYFERTIDADPGTAVVSVTATPEKAGDKPKRSDLLISKFDANGALQWARPIGNYGWETLGNLAVDSANNVFVAGSFYEALDFDPGSAKHVLTSSLGVERFRDINDNDRRYSYDAFLLKLSSSGRYQFATRFGGAGDDFATSVSMNADDQPLVAGQFRGTYVFPGTSAKLRPIGLADGFDALFDNDGNIIV